MEATLDPVTFRTLSAAFIGKWGWDEGACRTHA